MLCLGFRLRAIAMWCSFSNVCLMRRDSVGTDDMLAVSRFEVDARGEHVLRGRDVYMVGVGGLAFMYNICTLLHTSR